MAGTDNSYDGYLSKVRGSESGGDQYAKNPKSSASGLYQFTKGTWEGLGYNWKDRFNTGLQSQAMAKLTNNNLNYLKSNLGITPTDADLYGAHFLGSQGYASVYKTSSNTPLSSVLSSGVISSNPFLKGKTTGDLKNWLSQKMGSDSSTIGSGQEWQQYGVDTSIYLPTNTGEYQTAPDTPGTSTKEDAEADQAKAELLEKQKEKDFLAEVKARQEETTELRQQQEQQLQQQQDNGLDPSYYQAPQVELPNYQAIQYEQAQRQALAPQEQQQYKDGGSIPERYKNMGFTHVGQKKDGDGQHKWKVLAKKGDKYKVVQGGYRGMQDFSQHGSKKRQDNFWSRMGGRGSAKANDPFSPLYWHKRLGKWEDGGEFEPHMMYNPETNEGFMANKMEDHLEMKSMGYIHIDEMEEEPAYKNGGKIEGRVKCTNCGWSWDKSESTEKDMYNCHKCGGKSTGESVSQFQVGGRKNNPFATNQKNTNYSFFPTVGSIEKTIMQKTGITGFRKKAEAKAQAQGIKGSHNGGLDAIRHAASSAKTASLLPPGLGFIAANTLGAAHEVDREMNWRETASDLYNNFAGSLIGSIPFIDHEDRQDLVIEAQKRGFLHNVNKLEEGGEFAEEEMDYGQNDFALPNQDQEQGNPVWPQTPQPINPIWSQPVQPINPVWPQTPQPINPIWAQPVQRKPVKKAEKPKTTVTRKPSKYEYLFEKNNSKKVDTRDFVVPKFNGIKEGSGNSSQEILNYQQEKNKKVFQEEVKKQEESKAAKELSDFRKEITSKAILEDAIENDEIGLDINNYRTEKDVMNLQKMLTEKGYNLNPQGKFANNGIDGKLGNVTKNAMIKYNQHNSDSGYESIKEGTGFIGDCQESQCSEYMQNELFRNVQPKVSREDWNKKTGLFGDAWNIGENIIKLGGKKVEKGQAKPGDVITMYTGGRSPFQSQANAAGSGTTHTGLIDKVNPDGSYYILHNNHSTNRFTGAFEGKEYRDLVKDGVIVSGGAKRSFTVRGTFRPDYKEVQLGEKKILRDDVKLFLDPKKAVILSSKEYDNNFTSANAKNKLLNTFIKPLNDTRNKKTISKVFGLGDDEYQSLSKLTLGILGQETSFGTNAKYTTGTKEAGAVLAKLVGYKSDEASKGAGRLKYETNFGADDLTELGITEDNFDDEDKAPLTTMYKLATDYKKFLKKGYNKKDAMYRAVTVYNVSLGHVSQGKKVEDWAKNYDVDYTNKVLNYSNFFNIGDNKKQYKTTTDELLLHPNVYKWRAKLKKEKKL